MRPLVLLSLVVVCLASTGCKSKKEFSPEELGSKPKVILDKAKAATEKAYEQEEEARKKLLDE